MNFLAVFYKGTERVTKTIKAENLDLACEKANKIAAEQQMTAEDVLEV